jgi:hypothetical protein
MLLLWATAAWAGPAVELSGGGAIPLDADTASGNGPQGALAVGYHKRVGPVAVQPEVLVRTNLQAPVIVAGAGAQVVVGKPVGFGAYAHLGIGLQGYLQPSPDAGLQLVIDPPTPLVLALRAGWEWDHPLKYKCGDCAQPSEQWFTAGAMAGVHF